MKREEICSENCDVCRLDGQCDTQFHSAMFRHKEKITRRKDCVGCEHDGKCDNQYQSAIFVPCNQDQDKKMY